jgi:hypothetical protein
LTGCFTVKTVKKAKLDKKSESADSVLTSYKDLNGNTIIIYTKRNNKTIYKIVEPVDTIISNYRKGKTIDLINYDTTISNFKGVFFTGNVNGEKGFQRIIYFDKETTFSDTSNLHQEIGKNENLVRILTNEIIIPMEESDSTKQNKYITTKVVGFILKPISRNDNNSIRKETYIIAFEPRKRKYSRYFLLPLTVGLDGITLPFQIIFYGALLLISQTIKF